MFVHCYSGTYIRSLAREIALAAGSRAHLTALVRTKVAGFRLEDTVSIESGGFFPHPIDKAVFRSLGIPCQDISTEDAKKVVLGKPLPQILKNAGLEPGGDNSAAALFSEGEFVAMIETINGTWAYGCVYAQALN
jgi:tRNA pseudouridine55 synthase